MRVLLINDSSSNPNWGDRAAAYSLQAMIRVVGGEISAAVSELELGTSTFAAPSAGAHTTGGRGGARAVVAGLLPPLVYGAVRRVVHGLAARSPGRVPGTWQGFEKAAARFARAGGPWDRFVRAADETDVAVIHGDGCMTGNGLIPRTELLMAYVVKTYFGTPVIIVNHTGDFSHPALREIAEHVYPLFDDVVFREPVSVEACKDLAAGRFCPDTAFWFRPAGREAWAPLARRPGFFDVWPDTAAFDPAEPYLCVGGSSLFATRDAAASVTTAYTELAQHLRSVYAGQVVLTVSDLTDEAVLRTVAARLGLPLVALGTPVQQTVDILGNSDCYIGGRWHAAIGALSGGTPVVALSAKTLKMRALVDMAGLPAGPFSAWDLHEHKTAIGDLVRRYLDEGDALRDRLRAWSAGQAEGAWGNVDYLKTWQTA